MSYAQAILEAGQSITGDPLGDLIQIHHALANLEEQSQAFRILLSMAHVLAAELSDAQLSDYCREIREDPVGQSVIFHLIQSRIRVRDLDRAEFILQMCLDGGNRAPLEDEKALYLRFNDPLEDLFYRVRFKPSKEVLTYRSYAPKFYHALAYVLIEKEDLLGALRGLMDGLAINPLDTLLLFEMSEIFKMRRDWDAFQKITRSCFQYAHTRTDLARAYRNWGYMLIEEKDWEGAVSCYLMSLEYHPKEENALNQLLYISGETGMVIDTIQNEKGMVAALESRGIQVGPCEELIQLASYAAGRHLERNETKWALYFLHVVYEMTGSEKVADMMRQLQTGC